MAESWKSPVDPSVEIIHSTYLDNPFLSADYIEMIQSLAQQDENFYQVYALGHWGRLQHLIYTNYKVIPELPVMSGAKWAYGLDFGLVNPSALVKVYLLNDRFYLDERLYKENLTNSDIIEQLSHEERGDIYGDPSAKMLLEEIRRAGYSAFEGHKGVKESINLCQRQTLYIPQSAEHLIKEIRSYSWKKTKEGQILDEPVKFNDHACDAMRYAVWGLASRFGFATARPSSSGSIVKTLHFGPDDANSTVLRRWMKHE